MKIISFSLKRPVTISMIFLSLSFLGLVAVFRLPVEVMPDTDLNTITILVNLRGGMPPLEVESKVTRPVEEAVGGVSNLREMFSLSKEGQAMVILNFKPGYEMDRASLEVREKMAHLKNEFPAEAERPLIGRFNYNDMPVFILGIAPARPQRGAGPALASPPGSPHQGEEGAGMDSLDQVREQVEKKIKNRFLNLDGVANVELAGGERKRILVELDGGKLASLGIDIRTVVESLRNDNFNLRAGELREGEREVNLRTVGQYSNLMEMRVANLLSQGQERLIKVSEIGILKEGGLEKTSLSRLNGEEVVSIYIQKERSANTLAVTRAIKKELNKIEKEWRGQFKFTIVSDQGRFIDEAFSELRRAMILGIVLAVAILSIFLKDRQAVEAVILVMPVSILSTLFMLFVFHLSLNIFTLSALALGVGMLVDNAIVIVENISRYRRGICSEEEAVVSGGKRVGLAISSSTLTNVIVFLPLAFLRGETEAIFRSVGLTISFSLAFSLLAALTVVPMVMKRRRITAGRGETEEKKWRGIEKGYQGLVISILRRRNFIVPSAFIMAVIIFIPFLRLGREIVSPQDQSRLVIHVELPSGAKLSESDRVVREVEGCLRGLDEIETVSTQIENWSGKIFLTLRPARERRKKTEDIIAILRPQIEKIKGAFIYFEEPESLGNQEVTIDVFGHDYEKLKILAMEMAGGLAGIEGLEDIKIKMREGRPEIRAELRPGHLTSYGLTGREVAESLHAQMRGLRATYLHREGEEIETVVRLKKEDCDTLDKIKNLNFYANTPAPISLKQISDFRFGLSPSEIWHKDKKRMVSLSARRSSRLSLSKAQEEIEARLKKITLPPNYFYNYSRQFYDLKYMHREFFFILGLTALLVYMVLASFFESYLKPFIIILMIPLAFSGVAVFQVLRRANINLGVLLGLVMLSGMVVNAAILYVDRVRTLSCGRKGQMRIIIRAASERLRPILMTSFSTIFGLGPLALVSRPSANLWVELARTIMVGLIFSVFLSLLVIPAILSFFEGRPLLGRRELNYPLTPLPTPPLDTPAKRVCFAAPILLYHRVGPVLECEDNLPPDKFEGHIKALKDGGIEIVSLSDYLQKGFDSRRGAAVITFDDGMRNIYQNVFPLALKYGFSFTVFLNSRFIGKSNWHSRASRTFYNEKELAPLVERERLWFFEYLNREEILAMKERGITFGSHGLSHRLLTSLGRKDLHQEIWQSKKTLEEILKEEVVYFSYPWGTFNRTVKSEVKKSGYKFAFTSSLSAREDEFSMGRLLVKKDWDGERLVNEIKKGGKRDEN